MIERSGKKKWVHIRRAPKFPRHSFHEWGALYRAIVWARSYYQQLRSRGEGHHAAVRALAFKWLRIFLLCWKDRVAYDEVKYLVVFARGRSFLAAVSVAITGKALGTFCGYTVERLRRQINKVQNFT